MTDAPASISPDSSAVSQDRPPSHRNEAIALDRLGSTLGTMAPGALVLLYGPSGLDCDAVARIAANVFSFERHAAMATDSTIYPAVVVDAHFDRDGGLDLKSLFADIQARLGPPRGTGLAPTAKPDAATVLWARGRRQQLLGHDDAFLAAVNACLGRTVEVVVITHLERRGERIVAAVPGRGTETLTQFAAAAGVVLVLSGGFEVLDYRTTAAPVAEVQFRRYRPDDALDRAEFGRAAAVELASIGAGEQAGERDVVDYLLTHTLGSVGALRAWVARAAELLGRRPAGYTAEDVLAETTPQQPHALKAAAERIVAVEARLASEAKVTVDEVYAILGSLGGPDRSFGVDAERGSAAKRPRPNYANPQVLRPGERGPGDDPVGEPNQAGEAYVRVA